MFAMPESARAMRIQRTEGSCRDGTETRAGRSAAEAGRGAPEETPVPGAAARSDFEQKRTQSPTAASAAEAASEVPRSPSQGMRTKPVDQAPSAPPSAWSPDRL